jgi:hypothetical protein
MPAAKPKALTAAMPSAARLRSMFAASAEALLRNRPLRAVSTPPVQAGAVLSKGELTALKSVGLSTEPWPVDRPDDPLSRSIVDYMALIETSLTVTEAARLLGVDVSRVRQRLRE